MTRTIDTVDYFAAIRELRKDKRASRRETAWRDRIKANRARSLFTFIRNAKREY